MDIKWEKPRDYDRKNMLYPDRKMLKYQGMLLSDHSERIKDDKKYESSNSASNEYEYIEIPDI